MKSASMQTLKTQGRLHLYLDDDGQGLTIERQLLPEFLLQANALIQEDQVERAQGLLDSDHLSQVEQMLEQRPDLTDLMYIVAKLLQDVGLKKQAADWYRRIVAVEPHVKVLYQLSELISPVEALDYLRQALELEPENVDVLGLYARQLLASGQLDQGIVQLKEVLKRRPEADELRYGLLWHQHYLPEYDNAHFKEAYTYWAQQFYGSIQPLGRHRNNRDPHRRLRLAWISGGFKNNSPMTSFELITTLMNREDFEIYAYGNVEEPNSGTDRWQGLVDVYRDVLELDDEQAARLIQEDQIDILMEVGGVCVGSRLGVFAYKPAPVQVDYGALSTVGMPSIDYRFSCPILDPAEALKDYLEQTYYISPMCPFAPPSPSPVVSPLPAKNKGWITFGLFNNHRKMNRFSMDLWAKVLHELPEARVIMKFPQAGEAGFVESFQQQWRQLGIDPDRITFYGEGSYDLHLDVLGQCDLMLDTYPYNAARGTMEALWMGVPTVTLVGETFVSREGLAIQNQVGLDVFAATTPQEYVAKAVSFAQQWDHLDAIRQSLRTRMLASPLCDPQGWTLKFERALRQMWQNWCQTPN